MKTKKIILQIPADVFLKFKSLSDKPCDKLIEEWILEFIEHQEYVKAVENKMQELSEIAVKHTKEEINKALKENLAN